MPLSITCTADFCSTSLTFSTFPSTFHVDVSWLDPFSTASCRAIYSVLGGIFLVFSIPGHLELIRKKSVDMLERDMIGCTALWRHMLWVRD